MGIEAAGGRASREIKFNLKTAIKKRGFCAGTQCRSVCENEILYKRPAQNRT
jgi:hypothetical protein